jgi:maltose-binding protein MalE
MVSLSGYASYNYLKMCATAPYGRGPDLVAVQDVQLAQLINCRAIRPVPANVWSTADQGRYVKTAVLATRLSGQQWGMPWATTTYGIYYNRARVSPSFFASPTLTWARLVQKARSLTNTRTGHLGLAWDITNFYLDYAFVSGRGGYVFARTRSGFTPNTLGIDLPSSIAGLQFVRDLTTRGQYKLVPATMTGTHALTLFVKGRLAMVITGPWDQDSFRAYRVNFGFAPLPAMGARPSRPFANVQVFSVNRASKHSAQAFSLLRYMTTHMEVPEHSVLQLPVLKASLASPAIQRDDTERALARAILRADPVPNISAMTQVWGPMNVALTKIVSGKASVPDAVRQAARTIRSHIRMTGAR